MSYESERIRRLTGYAYGEQPTQAGVLKLNTNEAAFPPSPAVGRALAEFDVADLRRYPPATADPLREQVTEQFGLHMDQVVATNGGDEGLRLAMTTFLDAGLDAGATVGLATPSYSLYPVLAAVQGARVADVPLAENWLPPADFAARMNAAGAKLVCLPNPHAPSGTLLPAATVGALAEALNGVLLVDEAYVDFVDPALRHNLVPLLARHDNLLLLRTFSKGYALAGLRVGLLLGNAGLVEPIRTKTRDSFNVDAIAGCLARAALMDQEYAEAHWRETRAERQRLMAGLSALGFDVPPSEANFVLARVPSGNRASDVQRRLRARKVLVRYFDAPRLADCLRITVGRAEQTEALLKALAATLASGTGRQQPNRRGGRVFREAILETLLDNRDCDDERALSAAGGGKTEDVRWRRRGIYGVIRLIEENATAWEIPPSALREAVTESSVDQIVAVMWAVLRYSDRSDQAAIHKAGMADFPQCSNDGYAPMVRTICERIGKLDSDALADWRNALARQMARSVGTRSRAWIDELNRQIALLGGLPNRGSSYRQHRASKQSMPQEFVLPRLPNEQILSVILDAYQPCANFGKCREAKWQPERGHVPRGVLGATGTPAEVEVVMVFSEPGHPLDGEGHDSASGPLGLLQSAMQHTYNCYRSHIDLFHRNVRWFIDELFPDLTFDQQLRHVWLTEGRLCSIDNEIGSTKDPTCATHYLARQVKLLPSATVVAFGGKAQYYLRGAGVDFVGAYALAPPGANYKKARPSWQAAIDKIVARRRPH